MATLAFDTLAFADKLKESGMPAAQAEAQARAMAAALEASRQDVATKADLQALESKLETRFAKLEGEFMLVKWMLGLIVAGVVALVMKSFL
jgi:hypothetical protein